MLNDIPFDYTPPRGKGCMIIIIKEYSRSGELNVTSHHFSIARGKKQYEYLKNKIYNESCIDFEGYDCKLGDEDTALFDYDHYVALFLKDEMIASIECDYGIFRS